MIYQDDLAFEEVTQAYTVYAKFPGVDEAKMIVFFVLDCLEMLRTATVFSWYPKYKYLVRVLKGFGLPEANLIERDKVWSLAEKKASIRYYLTGILSRIRYQLSIYAEPELPELEGILVANSSLEYSSHQSKASTFESLVDDGSLVDDPWENRSEENETLGMLNQFKQANRELTFSLPNDFDLSEKSDSIIWHHFSRIQDLLRARYRIWSQYKRIMTG